jgi:transcriptional regulator of acetoin/glycerol metabolism
MTQSEVSMSYEFIQLALQGRKQITLGDSFQLLPLNGRRSEIKLNRTYLELGRAELIKKRGHGRVELPCLKNEQIKFGLTFQPFYKKSDEHNGYYVLESLTSSPFMHNNIYTFKAIIEDRDEVWLGHNRLIFAKHQRKSNSDNSFHGLNPEMIQSNLPIYLEGETGTGKSTLARHIHQHSGVRGNFVQVNLASFSPALIEAELFGHKRGAFTGAINDRHGALMQANHGTLFLDEIDSLPSELQTKLLLFLDNGEFRPVGSHKVEKIKFRLITASGKQLHQLVEQEIFRKDLYFRLLAGFKLELPPLRIQPELIKNKIGQFCRDHHLSMTESLVDFYCQQAWPGNLRQLNAHLMRKKVLSLSHKLDLDQHDLVLKQALAHDNEKIEWCSLEVMKRNYAQKIYTLNKNNLTVTSNILHITPKTLKRLVA